MELKDKLVIDETTIESVDEAGRTQRTPVKGPVSQFINNAFSYNYNNDLFRSFRHVGNVDGTSYAPIPTWAKREYMRSREGLNAKTEALEIVNGACPWYFVHISKEDPTQVAFTPSEEYGNADRQLRMPFAKFLKKYFLLYTDRCIAALDAQHKAELNPNVKYATSKKDIMRVYTTMVGDSGCMRYKTKDRWASYLEDDQHPTHAYADIQGLSVAYLEDEEGRVRARCVIYENGDDKRMVRYYGSAVLERVLQRNGFKYASLNGVYLNKIPAIHDDHYVLPYLDGPQGDQSNNHGKFVVIDGDKLKVVDRETAAKYRAIHSYGAADAVAYETGCVKLVEVNVKHFVCPLTGLDVNPLTDRTIKAQMFDGSFADVLKGPWLDMSHDTGLLLSRMIDGKKVMGIPLNGFKNYVHINSENWYKEDASYEACGYARLDARFGGEMVCYYVTVADINGKTIVAPTSTPVSYLISETGERIANFLAEDAKLLGRSYVKCRRYNEREVYSHRDNPNLVKMDTGAPIDSSLHRSVYRQCVISGKWGHKDRGLQEVYASGGYKYVLASYDASQAIDLINAETTRKLIAKAQEEMTSLLQAADESDLLPGTIAEAVDGFLVSYFQKVSSSVCDEYFYKAIGEAGLKYRRPSVLDTFDAHMVALTSAAEGTTTGVFNHVYKAMTMFVEEMAGLRATALALAERRLREVNGQIVIPVAPVDVQEEVVVAATMDERFITAA